ncbi:hypothetical protein DESA109040_02385 [Deinococcus saxicola]|uniref:TRAFAC clade GTPase domain-containing protein n=1 Tax=Deinococcus saxicola TaxID=249406 RepID=UPI0039F051DA
MTSLPPCSNPVCEIEETGRCRLHGTQYAACKYLKGKTDVQAIPEQAAHTRLPWTGRALTPISLPLIAGRRRPHLVAVIGLPGSGKTSFLISLFMRVRRHDLTPYTFAGSLTLAGWSLLTRYADWTPGVTQHFPPRTSGAQREPGFLHLAFRDQGDQLIDVALADAPGEWFDAWILKDPADTTLNHPPGWLVTNATTVLFFVNTFGLYDEFDANVVVDQTITLADRVAASRPAHVQVIYAQTDRIPEEPNDHLNAVLHHLERVFPGHVAFRTSSVWHGQRGSGVLEALQAALTHTSAPSVRRAEAHTRTLAGWLRGTA